MRAKLILSVAIVGLLIVGSVTVLTSQGSNESALLIQLQSKDWDQRYAAFNELILIPDVLKSDEIRTALIDLLDKENRLINSTLAESSGQSGVSVKYGEDYSEYYSRIQDAVEDIASYFDNTHALDVLTRSAYSYDSPLAAFLVKSGKAITTEATTSSSGLLFNRLNRTYNGTISIRNNTDQPIIGPIQVVLTNLTPGVTLVNATGMYEGDPYIIVVNTTAIKQDESVNASIQFSNLSNEKIIYWPNIYSGNF